MIRISCTNCKTVLTIDDAFAGGVCRCQYCGTIQTVPAQARESAAAATGQAMGGSKQIYQNDARSGTGLDELAGIVVSSGLSSSRLTRRSNTPGKNSKNLMPLFIGAGAIILILLIIIVVMALRGGSAPQAPSDNGQPQASTGVPGEPTVNVNAPNFCGTKITGSTVVYLLDCGVATQDFLGDLKDAAIRSLGTLGSDHKFQILFWSNQNSVIGYPAGSTTYATKENIDAAHAAIEDQPAYGQTDILPALKTALDQHPDVIIIVTGKGWDLDNNWVSSVMKARDSSSVRIDTFNLGSTDSSPLKSLAEKTGGSYRTLAKSDLRSE